MDAYVAGDRAAFEQLFHRYAPRLTRMLRRDVRRDEDVADLVQQTFLQLHRARRDFRSGATVRPWLYTIALNLKRQYFRRAGRRSETSYDADKHGEPVSRARDADDAVADAQLRRVLRQLPENQRIVIELHWFEGLSFHEVAKVVGAKQSAVKVRAHRGYEKLRAIARQEGLAPDGVTAADPSAYGDGRARG